MNRSPPINFPSLNLVSYYGIGHIIWVYGKKTNLKCNATVHPAHHTVHAIFFSPIKGMTQRYFFIIKTELYGQENGFFRLWKFCHILIWIRWSRICGRFIHIMMATHIFLHIAMFLDAHSVQRIFIRSVCYFSKSQPVNPHITCQICRKLYRLNVPRNLNESEKNPCRIFGVELYCSFAKNRCCRHNIFKTSAYS